MAEQLDEKFYTLSAFLRSRVEDHGGLKTLFLEYTDQEILENLDLEVIKNYLQKNSKIENLQKMNYLNRQNSA